MGGVVTTVPYVRQDGPRVINVISFDLLHLPSRRVAEEGSQYSAQWTDPRYLVILSYWGSGVVPSGKIGCMDEGSPEGGVVGLYSPTHGPEHALNPNVYSRRWYRYPLLRDPGYAATGWTNAQEYNLNQQRDDRTLRTDHISSRKGP